MIPARMFRPRFTTMVLAAISAAQPGDVVLLAGKGHERTIERDGVDEEWDEAATAQSVLSSLGYSPKL